MCAEIPLGVITIHGFGKRRPRVHKYVCKVDVTCLGYICYYAWNGDTSSQGPSVILTTQSVGSLRVTQQHSVGSFIRESIDRCGEIKKSESEQLQARSKCKASVPEDSGISRSLASAPDVLGIKLGCKNNARTCCPRARLRHISPHGSRLGLACIMS